MYKNYRINEISKKLDIMGVHPLDILVTGVTGAGKSTTLNTFFENEVSKVGKGTDPETMKINSFSLSDSLRLWDSPGLGDGIKKDTEHSKKIVDTLYKTYNNKGVEYGFIDIVLVIIEGSNRDMGTTYKLLNEVVLPNFQEQRVLVAINQADMAMKGRNWNKHLNKPNELLLNFLEKQAVSIRSRVKEATGMLIPMPIFYSAEYNYNIKSLFDLLINNIPSSKRKLLIEDKVVKKMKINGASINLSNLSNWF